MNTEPAVKPRIRADLWKRSGFNCRSNEGPNPRGRGILFVLATGDTMEEAYANWQSRRELLQTLTEDPFAHQDAMAYERIYRRTLNPFARLIRRLAHGKVGKK